MQPQKVLTINAIDLKNGAVLPQWSYVWKLALLEHNDIMIEYKNQHYQIASHHVIDVPVKALSAEQRSLLDPCFANIADDLELIYSSDKYYFSIYRCYHGHYYLEDVRGGIAMYRVWIFLGLIKTDQAQDWNNIWKKFHHLPTDALLYLGISC